MSIEAAGSIDLKEPPRLGGGLPWLGHILPFTRNPYLLMQKAAGECGEVAAFTLLGQRIVLLTGDEASTVFYRSSDEEVDQSAAYKLMTPIFGPGLVFDAPLEKKNEQLKMLMPSLRVQAMRTHAEKVVQEVKDMMQRWGDSGEINLVEEMVQLTIHTASHCLLGREFRYELTDEFAQIYHDLELGVHPLAYNFPNLPLPRFKKRDAARIRLQQLVSEIVKKREAQTEKPSDMLQSLIDTTYESGEKLTHNEITGMLTAAIFAGHHTSSGTAAWVLLELLKQPSLMRRVREELDGLLDSDADVNFQSLREMPTLENHLKEVLRLHPPLIILMRQVLVDLQVKGYRLRKGDMIWASPPVTHRMAKHFPNPLVFDIDRYAEGRREDKNLMAYQPFGGGKHKCSGNSFALFQIKAIFAVLLRHYEFELVDSPDSYVDDYTQMIVQPKSPCRVRYRLRNNTATTVGAVAAKPKAASAAAAAGCPFHAAATVSAEKETIKDAMERKQSTGEGASVVAAEEGVAETVSQVAPAAQPTATVSEPTRPTSAAAEAEAAAMQVVVDRQLCQGHAMCMGEDAQRFHVDDKGELTVLKQDVAPEELETVRQQISYCPNQALSVQPTYATAKGQA